MTGPLGPLPFELGEFQRRLAAVRDGLAERSLDLLLVFTPENVTYLTGYETIGYSSFQCLLVPAEGELVLVVRELEQDVAAASTWLSSFVAIPDGTSGPARLVSTLQERGYLAGRIGLESTSPFLTARDWDWIRGRLGAAEVSDGSGIVEHARRIKSPDEIAHIRHACHLAEAGMSHAVDATHAGVSENAVAVRAYDAMVSGGSGFLAADPIVTSGPRSGIAHTTFGDRRMQLGDTVLIELGASRARYFGALMRTVVIGHPSEMISRCARAVQEGLDAAIDVLRPGVAGSKVDAACREVFDRHGLGQFFRKRTGYSVGVAFAPDWGEGHIVNLGPHEEQLLEPGMVFHIPPALRVPGEFCVGSSETVLVTDQGSEPLTRFAPGLIQSSW